MATRGWTLSTFVGCCVWILHGLGAAAVPVTTEGPFAAGTTSPVTTDSEGLHTLVMGTAETSTAVADAEIAESILAGSSSSPPFPPGTESDVLVTAVSEYSSTVPTLMNVTKPLNTSQDIEKSSAAPTAATATAISVQHPAVTPEAELVEMGATPEAPLGTTPLFADGKEDILVAVTKGAEDLDPPTGAISLPTTPPLAATWGAQPTADSPMGNTVIVLPSQGLTTAMGTVEEGVTLPVDIQSEASANSSSPSPGAGGPLTSQQDGVVSETMDITPEPVGETALAAEESPSASVPGDAGDAVNGEFSIASSSHLPLESPAVSETVENPGEPSLLPGQAVLSPAASLAPASIGDGDGQGAPVVSSEGPGSALSPAASEASTAPGVTGDTATSLLAPGVPTDAQSDTNPTALPTGDVGLTRLFLQPAPWQNPTREQPQLLTDALPSPTDTLSTPGAAFPLAWAGTSTLPAVDDEAETPASPDLTGAPEAPVSPSLGGSQPWGMAAGAPQGAEGPDTGLTSASDAPNPASSVTGGLTWPAGVQGQETVGAGDMAQAGPGNGSPHADTQSDTSPSAFGTQQDPANIGELPAGETGALANTELSPPSDLGDGAGAAPPLGQVSPPGSEPASSAGLEPNFSGSEGPGDLPGEFPSAPGAAYPAPGAAAGPVSGAETSVSHNLGAAQGAPVSPPLEGSQPWGMAAGAPQGAEGPDTGLTSASDAPNPASSVTDGLTWPAGVQGQETVGAGDMAQAGPGNGSPHADTQSDTSPSAFGTQQDPANTGELPAEGTGTLANTELPPPSALGDGAGAAPPLGQVSPPGSEPASSAGLEPNFSGSEGPGDLPGEFPSAPGAAYPVPGAAAGPVSGAETSLSHNLGAAQEAPVSPSFGGSQPWETAAGAPQGAGLPGASGPDTGLTSAWDAPSSAAYGPSGSPSPALGDQLGTNLGLPAAEGHGAGTTEQVLGAAGSGTGFEPPVVSSVGSGTAAGVDQLSGAGSSSSSASPSDVVSASSISEGDGAGPNPAAAPGPDSLSSASPDSETGPELTLAQGTESTGDVAQAGNQESESPYVETSPSAFSTQQDPANTGELPAGETGALANTELPPPSALGDGAGAAPPLGQVFPPDSEPASSAGLEPNFSGSEGPGDLPGEFPSAPGAAYPVPGAAAETSVNPGLGAAQGAPVSPSFGGSQPWETAADAPQGAGLPGASGPDTGLTSAWDAPSSAAYGPSGSPSPALGDQLGTGSSSGSASSSDVVTGSSISGPASPSDIGGTGSAPVALQPSLDAGPGAPPAAEGAGEAAGDGGSLGQSQAPAGEGSAGSGAPDGEMGAMLQSASSSPPMEGSSSPGMAGEAANGANLPGAGGASGGLSTGLKAAGPEEPSVSAPGIQSGANLGLSDAKLSQVNVVEMPGRSSVNKGPSPGASLGEGAGAVIQIASGELAPSSLTSPQAMQPLVPVAPKTTGISDNMATSLASSLLLPGHGLSSGLATNGDPHSTPGTQSGSRPLVPGRLGGMAGDAGGSQTWSLEDEVASGMPAPLGEGSPHALVSPSAVPALPSAPQRENAAEGVSSSPGLAAPFSTREWIRGFSAGGTGELGAATPGGDALLLPPHQLGSPRAPSRDAGSLMPGKASAVLPRVMAGRGDMAQLLSRVTGAEAGVETPIHSPSRQTPGLPGLPPARIAAGSPGSKTPGPRPAGGSSPTARQPFLGGKLTTSLANRAPVANGLSLPAAFPGQRGARGGPPITARPAVSCSPATASLAPPAPHPGGREVLPRPGASTVTSRASSLVFPALPGGPAAALTPLPGPTVAAVPLYGYGIRENDREYVERRVDFNSPLFKPETGFPFGKTLRNSLYFTDNGQIIFPASDNNIFMYPNPPPRGFNGHEEVPMIAVFWDNADFSRGVGTTFYQEFLTLNTAKPPFVRDVEAKVRRYLRSSYSAAWTLKITWERAPAYTAWTDTRRTITYQAILTTDGFRSYVLILYQEGGMQWDYTRLAATNVLIGYTSGDGFYRNDDLTRRPPAAKYRPDQFRGYNTDLRGLWIYKLESRVGVNYRLKCLAWTGRQQEPQVWSQGLPACPCSLQQGQQDPRFKSSRGGWWAARVSMLHSASPNQHGAGIRCLYDSQSQLIEGRQERYWRSSRQASPYRDQELKLYDWCCNQAGSTRLCAHYGKKRPKIGCDGYQLPSTGSSEEAENDSEDQRDEEDE